MVRFCAMITLLGTLWGTLTMTAQEQAPPQHAPDGGVWERVQSLTILPTPNAPFSATVTTEWTKLLPDGTTSLVKNHRTVARDGSGRIFEERRWFSPNGDTEETRLSNMQYADPIRHEFYDCHPEGKVCVVYPYHAAATVNLAVAHPVAARMGATTTEDLGHRMMDDLELLGSRQVTTLRAGAIGNQIPEPIVKEFWYSPQLQINVEVKRFDPRSGQLNFGLKDLSLMEPNAALLTPPADYKIVPAAPYSIPR
jgi:hypothetical protein